MLSFNIDGHWHITHTFKYTAGEVMSTMRIAGAKRSRKETAGGGDDGDATELLRKNKKRKAAGAATASLDPQVE